jgi:hypothetical protein
MESLLWLEELQMEEVKTPNSLLRFLCSDERFGRAWRGSERLIIYCQTTSVSAAHAPHCATYCTPCRPLIRAFSGWILTPPPTVGITVGVSLRQSQVRVQGARLLAEDFAARNLAWAVYLLFNVHTTLASS